MFSHFEMSCFTNLMKHYPIAITCSEDMASQ